MPVSHERYASWRNCLIDRGGVDGQLPSVIKHYQASANPTWRGSALSPRQGVVSSSACMKVAVGVKCDRIRRQPLILMYSTLLLRPVLTHSSFHSVPPLIECNLEIALRHGSCSPHDPSVLPAHRHRSSQERDQQGGVLSKMPSSS